MVLGVISIIIGLIFDILGFMMNPNGAPQQTVQYLGFVVSAIFIVGGFLIIKINNSTQEIVNIIASKYQTIKNENEISINDKTNFEKGILIVDKDVELYSKPESSIRFWIEKINKDTEVVFIKSNEKQETIDGITAPWFFVRINNEKEGWVFSGNLKKV